MSNGGAIVSTGERTDRIEPFIARWQGREGGQERANYGLFLTELCEALELPRPDPADASPETNDYVFERVVKEPARGGEISSRRIDLYKRGCFVLEAKQSRWKGGDKDKEVAGQTDLFVSETAPRGRRGAERSWDVLMLNARQQAESYVRLLPSGHEPPPFVIVCDVGHCFEVYANFRRDGKAYDQFPDRQTFRIYLEELRDAKTRERLKLIWSDPLSLDPALESARVTRAIAVRLAAVSKALEAKKFQPEDVATFLMRCLFTMFAEDVGLLPEASFRNVLERCERDTSKFQPMVGQLWEAMDKGEFAYAIEAKVKQFNGEFFKSRLVLPLGREEIGELRQAASHNWRDVDPSIFGTLLEQALDPNERRRLGAHYTPRAYVERLVIATIIEPLREDWAQVLATAERQKSESRAEDAAASVAAFHDKLCKTRILDPACGTGNFLYVSLELLKRLEGEVLEALAGLGGQEALSGLEGHTVDPHQFLGMELNPRAAAIAELVLWIGHLQWHLRTKGGMPSEPILKAFKNIVVKDAVLDADKTLARDAHGRPIMREIRLSRGGGDAGEAPPVFVETYVYETPRRPKWPTVEFIVGNPPFIGKGELMRAALGQYYLEALWAAHPHMNESADFVLYWWDRAADLLIGKDTVLRRFGLVTTNSITQIFNRRVVERHLRGKRPISLVMAIPDHPWSKATPDAAAVRIAMTVAQAGALPGVLGNVVHEAALDSDTPMIELREWSGTINSDLTVGSDVTSAIPLRANDGLASMGPAVGGRGFVLTKNEADHLGYDGRSPWLKRLTTGRDITGRHRGRYVIDVRDYETEDALRHAVPRIYQHLRSTVYPARKSNNDPNLRNFWWKFRRSNEIYFGAIGGLSRYVATVETTKHRVFIFVSAKELVEHGVIGFGLQDAWFLGILSSRIHVCWALANGGTLEDRPRYNKDVCFDPFPFPLGDDLQKQRIRALAEELDAHRKRVLTDHPYLTMTGIYNVLETVRAEASASSSQDDGNLTTGLTSDDRRIFDDGLVLILKELHDKLDAAVADAYGWPADLADEEILSRLLTLNKGRVKKETEGIVQWLRPDYQIPRFGSVKEKAELDLVGGKLGTEAALPSGPKPSFPTDDLGQNIAVTTMLAAASGPLDASSLAATFRQGRRIAPKVASILAALSRMGFVTTGDGGTTFLLRRAA
jgi:hypothetical protein